MRLSRWGQSPYETNDDIAKEAESVGRYAQVLAPGLDAEIVVVHSKIAMSESEHRKAPGMRLLVTTTSGTDHIDVDYFHARGVSVARLPDARRDAVVDSAIEMLIWGLRRTGDLQLAAIRNEWARNRLPEIAPRGIRGARIGLIGLGVIGQQMLKVLSVMGAEVWAADPRGVPASAIPASVERMLSECDAVSLHCDLNPLTEMLLDRQRLQLAHPELVIVNTARGALVDADAALNMVADGRLGAVALDVFSVEPWPKMNFEHPRIMLTPHAAGFHTGLAEAVRNGLIDAVSAFIEGRPIPHLVEPRQ